MNAYTTLGQQRASTLLRQTLLLFAAMVDSSGVSKPFSKVQASGMYGATPARLCTSDQPHTIEKHTVAVGRGMCRPASSGHTTKGRDTTLDQSSRKPIEEFLRVSTLVTNIMSMRHLYQQPYRLSLSLRHSSSFIDYFYHYDTAAAL